MRNRVLLGVAYVAGLRASEIGPLEAEGVVWHEAGQIFSILVRRGKGSGQDVRLPLDRPVSRMLGVWLATRPAGRFLWGRPLTRGAVRNIFLDRCAEVGRPLSFLRRHCCAEATSAGSMPQDVGAALADYLLHGRPHCSTRRVSVRTRAPFQAADVHREALAALAVFQQAAVREAATAGAPYALT